MVIEASDERQCWNYASLFFAKAREAEAVGDNVTQEVFDLLGAVSSLMLKPDSKDEPLAPQVVFKTGRSAIVDDFTDAHLDLFKALLPDIADAEMRARVGDLLWVSKRHDFQAAQIAVEAYLASAKDLEDPSDWPEGADRLERALRIAAVLDRKARKRIYYPRAVAAIEDILARCNGEDPSFLSSKMMDLLLEHREGDATLYAALAEKAALRAEAAPEWLRAREYWGLAARWHARGGDAAGERTALIRVAETYVAEAEYVLPRPSQGYLVAARHLQSAIEAFRQVGDMKERVEEVHRRLLEYQRESLKELETASATVDVTRLARSALAHIEGKPLSDALFALALYGSLPNPSFLRGRAEAQMARFSPQNLAQTTLLGDEGRNIAHRPALVGDDDELRNNAIRAAMFEEAKLYRSCHAAAVVEPMRTQIVLEHSVRLADILPFVGNNPFVPPGREWVFARGLHAGLIGDLLVAASLLIPQVENSLRHVLTQHGVITSKLDANRIQDAYDLNAVFDRFATELNAIFGEDLVFDLEGLLIRRNGSNLRNLLAHGLLSHDSFNSTEVVYFWWLTMRICCVQVVLQRALSEEVEPTSTSQIDIDSGGRPES
jgi:hypothetical protein